MAIWYTLHVQGYTRNTNLWHAWKERCKVVCGSMIKKQRAEEHRLQRLFYSRQIFHAHTHDADLAIYCNIGGCKTEMVQEKAELDVSVCWTWNAVWVGTAGSLWKAEPEIKDEHKINHTYTYHAIISRHAPRISCGSLSSCHTWHACFP